MLGYSELEMREEYGLNDLVLTLSKSTRRIKLTYSGRTHGDYTTSLRCILAHGHQPRYAACSVSSECHMHSTFLETTTHIHFLQLCHVHADRNSLEY
jgi:hypothetical protein